MPAINQVRKDDMGATTVGGTANRLIFVDKDGNEMINRKGWSMTRGLVEEFRDLHDWTNGNRIRLIDSMQYATDATAAAAWVSDDTAATTGIAATKDISDNLNGTASVLFTTGSAFAAATDVTKTLSSSTSSYPEDNQSLNKAYQNWEPYNYIIIPYHAGQALAAADLVLIIADSNGNEASYDLPATSANHADTWQTFAVPFSSMTEDTGFRWRNVSTVTLQFDGTAMGNAETISVDEIYLCKYCNGFTPVMGHMTPVVLGADNMVEGMQCKLAGASVLPVVSAGGDGDEEIIGILCGSGDTGDVVLMQDSGLFVGELGALTSLEVGDYCAGAASGGLTWTESAGTGADAIAKYIAPFQDAAAQYTLVWFTLNTGGALPS